MRLSGPGKLCLALAVALAAPARADDDDRSPAESPPPDAAPVRRRRPAREEPPAEKPPTPPPAAAEPPPADVAPTVESSVFSPEGVEVKADARLFALFALLNADGYDDGPIRRALPAPKHAYGAVRADVRKRLAAAKLPEGLFDKAPRTPATLALEAVAGKPVEGLDDAAKAAGIDVLFAAALPALRADLKRWAAAVDAPLAKTRAALGLPGGDDAPKTTLAVEVLASPELATGESLPDGSVALVVGDAAADEAPLVARALARASLEPALAGMAAKVKQLAEVRAAVAATAAGADVAADPQAYLVDAFVEAAVAKAVAGDGAAAKLDAAVKRGNVLAKDAAKALDAADKGKGTLAERLGPEVARLEARKAAEAFLKSAIPPVR